MSAAAWAALFGGLTFITVLFGGIYTYGRLTQRVCDHDDRLDGHHDRLEVHEAKLNSHAEQLAHVRGWKDGFNAARKSGSAKDG